MIRDCLKVPNGDRDLGVLFWWIEELVHGRTPNEAALEEVLGEEGWRKGHPRSIFVGLSHMCTTRVCQQAKETIFSP